MEANPVPQTYEDASKTKRLIGQAVDLIPFAAQYYFYQLHWYEIIPFLFLYFAAIESTTHASLGKILMGTKVVTEDFEPPTLRHILIRTACRFVPFDTLSFVFDYTGWHDVWSKTRVVEIGEE
jgi:uncharacterized RDD family membrane protein YckC